MARRPPLLDEVARRKRLRGRPLRAAPADRDDQVAGALRRVKDNLDLGRRRQTVGESDYAAIAELRGLGDRDQ